jgi:hypothetical protein
MLLNLQQQLTVSRVLQSYSLGNYEGHTVRLTNRRKIDQDRTIREVIVQPQPDLGSKARLTDSRRAHQRKKVDIVAG